MNADLSLVWFHRDLRLADNPALERAVALGGAILPVFIWAPEEESPWTPGGASCWWLHQSLRALDAALEQRGSKLILRRGPTEEALLALAAESGAKSIFRNRCYEPAIIARDRRVERILRQNGIELVIAPGNLLFEPETIQNREQKPFQVFTPFWRSCLAMPEPPAPKPVPRHLAAPPEWPTSLELSSLQLEPHIDWARGLRETWHPGEQGAAARLKVFLKAALEDYRTERDRPDHTGTARLSPHLHFGEISARHIWSAIRRAVTDAGQKPKSAGPNAAKLHATEPDVATSFLRQIAWREFSYHLLFHFPRTPREPLRPEFQRFPWRTDAESLEAWTRGRTGYPLVDAGMRELWHTGWMHNRVRMVVASFLVKHLLIPWQEGAAWFWDTLADADLANNTMGWQWTAGCGADAAPYFRIFNPVLQGEKFDPQGSYVRRWVPELAKVPQSFVHRPWEAPGLVLAEAGATLGKDYPMPIVEHEAARRRALSAFAKIKGA